MPRSFLVKKFLKSEESGYHSYRVREPYELDVLDISLKAVTPYTPYSDCTPCTPPDVPAVLTPLTVRVSSGYIHDAIPSPTIQNGGDAENAQVEASTPHLESESAAVRTCLQQQQQQHEQPQQEEEEPYHQVQHQPQQADDCPQHEHQREQQHEQLRCEEQSETEDTEQHEAEDKNDDPLFNNGVTIGYTYDAFFITDGRSKRRQSQEANDSPKEEIASTHSSSASKPVCGRPRYTCNECGKDYATSSNLSRHKQTHRSLDSKNAKKCPHCDKLYVSMPALSMHILTHDLRHVCKVCGKNFSRPWLLQGHMRSHTGEKPYGCAHCGKAFADRSNLRAHMQTHSALKHFACDRCNKSFALKSYLNKHCESSCLKQ